MKADKAGEDRWTDERLFLYLPSSLHLSWSTTEHLFEVLGVFGGFFVFFFLLSRIILSSPPPNKLTPGTSHLPLPHLF